HPRPLYGQCRRVRGRIVRHPCGGLTLQSGCLAGSAFRFLRFLVVLILMSRPRQAGRSGWGYCLTRYRPTRSLTLTRALRHFAAADGGLKAGCSNLPAHDDLAREIAAELAARYQIVASNMDTMNALVAKVRNTLARQRGLASEMRGDAKA